MLLIKRKAREAVSIRLSDGIDPTMTLADLFSKGGIRIEFLEIHRNRATVAVEAPPEFKILRES